VPTQGQCLFDDATATVGLGRYVAHAGDDHGPGAVFTDLDGDGFPDLYLPGADPTPENRLFVNVEGPGGTRRFEPVPDNGGAGNTGQCTGAVAADYDNDGDLDIYVINFDGPNALLRNELVETGELAFVDVTALTDPTPGIDDPHLGVGDAVYEGVPLDNSLTAAWSDVDRDGDLDLYVGNHNGWHNNNLEGPFDVPGRRDVFYMNNGDGTFDDVTMTYGLTGFVTADGASSTSTQRYSSTNAVIFADFDGDMWPDLLVTNKIGGPTDRDMLYMNLGAGGDGTWLGYEVVTWNLEPAFGNKSSAAMGVDVGDPDNDGDLDIYITDFSNPNNPDAPGRNDLWRNQLAQTGELSFVHEETAVAIYSWGTVWQDFDNDGREDLHVATHIGFADYLYLNSDEGLIEQSEEAGVAQVRDARGDVSADYNGDGWADLLVINRSDGPSVLYENTTWQLFPERHHLKLLLRGDTESGGALRVTRDAIGARITIGADTNGDGVASAAELQIREVRSGASNAASTSSLAVEVGLGAAGSALIRVEWPDGTTSIHDVLADRTVLLDQADLRPGDFNADGVVGVLDLVAVFVNWGECPESPALCIDEDGNGVVDLVELQLVLFNWG
jgi:hypothetical protein